MDVRLVHVEADDGVRLDGYLREPTATEQRFGLDLVICHHGVGGNFYSPSFFDPMGDELLANGCSILRVNSRGHDQLVLQGARRLGAAYELIDDCKRDFGAWLDFAEERGFRRIALWGHSLGAVKTVYFLAEARDPRVRCAIASSPPRFSYAAYTSAADGARFLADVTRAEQLIGSGQADALMEALVPVPRPFSARTYIDKYGRDARFDYFGHLANVRVPLLFTLGGLERADVSFAPLADQGPSFAMRWPGLDYALVDGADHSYTSRTRELWAAVSGWLETVGASAVV